MTKQFTGRHMSAILVVFFGVVMAVNFTMAHYASSTFGGIVVENSYVASQNFNHWLARDQAQQALGWTAKVARGADNALLVSTTGTPANAQIVVIARHPLGRDTDRTFTFTPAGTGRYISRERLPPGRWIIRLEIAAGGHTWRSEGDLR